jgi:hypothetical protein
MDKLIETVNLFIEENKKQWLILRIIVGFGLLLVLINVILQAVTMGLDPDEIEHAHAGWLMFKGKVIYQDFYENHPPIHYLFIMFYYKFFGENTSVFFWTRALMVTNFFISITLLYLIGKELFGSLGGLLASMIFSFNRLAQNIAIVSRPDGFMLVTLLGGIYCFLRAWKKEFYSYQAIMAGLLLGLSFSAHPRGGFVIIGLAITTLYISISQYGIKQIWERKKGLFLFAIFYFLPIFLPFFIYGFKTYYQAVYFAGTRVVFYYEPWEKIWLILTQSFAIFPLAFIALGIYSYEIIKNIKTPKSYVLAFFLTLTSFVGLTLWPIIRQLKGLESVRGPMPDHNYYIFILTLSLFVSGSFVWVVGQLDLRKRLIVLYLICILGVVSNLRPRYWYFSWTGLKTNLEFINKANLLIPEQETYLGVISNNPVFRKDATYFWHDDLAFIKNFDPNFHHDFVADLEKNRPFLVNQDFLNLLNFDPIEKQRLKEYIEKNYHPVKNMPNFRIRN